MAWEDETGQHCVSIPETMGDIAALILQMKASNTSPNWTCYMEDIPSFIGGKKLGNSMTKLHRSAGRIEGLLCAYNFRVIMVTPQKWQKHFSLGKRSGCSSDSEWKNKLKSEAQRRFPLQTVTLKTADALLILDYAISTDQNQ